MLFLINAGVASLLKISNGAVVPLSEIISELKKSHLVFVGEQHDDPSHHEAQLEVIRHLHENGAEVAIGLEMFQSEDQKALDDWISKKITTDKFTRYYYKNWSLPWSLYSEIFTYAREHNIPMIGLNVPQEIVNQVASRGFSSLTPEQLRRLPGVSCEVNPQYREYIRKAFGRHRSDQESFEWFCEAQMVWDTTMADNLVRYLNANPGHTVVVLAGEGHSWRYGIPEQVRRRSDYKSVVILPETPELNRTNASTAEADYLWVE